jgi:hypothetical protein
MIFIEIKTSPFRLIFRRAFRYAVLNCGNQLYTRGFGLSIVAKVFAVVDEIIEKARVAWFLWEAQVAWSLCWLELPAAARTSSLRRSPNR